MVQTLRQGGDVGPQVGVLQDTPHLEKEEIQHPPHLLVRVLLKRVEVHPHRAREEDGVLGDDRDPAPEALEAELRYVDAIDADAAS
jgi:hypothetical protein